MHFQFETEAIASLESAGFSGYVYTYAAARITRLSMRTMRHHAQTGVIPAIRRGRRCWMFKAVDLHDFNERRAAERELVLAVRPQDSLRVAATPAGKVSEGLSPCWKTRDNGSGTERFSEPR